MWCYPNWRQSKLGTEKLLVINWGMWSMSVPEDGRIWEESGSYDGGCRV